MRLHACPPRNCPIQVCPDRHPSWRRSESTNLESVVQFIRKDLLKYVADSQEASTDHPEDATFGVQPLSLSAP